MLDKLKVAIVTEIFMPVHGGVPVAIAQLASGLVTAGHEVIVIANRLSNDDTTAEIADHPDGYKVYRVSGVPYPFDHEYTISVFPGKKIKKILDDFKPSVIHVHTPWGMLQDASTAWARKNKIAVVGTNHIMAENADASIGILGPLSLVISPMVARFTHKKLDKCQIITAPTKTALEIMKAESRKTPSVPVTNGIDTEYYAPRSSEYASQYGRYIASVGRLAQEKHIDLLLDAVKIASSTYPDIKLLIAGRGPMLENLKAQASQLNIEKNVVFLGYVSDDQKVDLLSGAVCYVNAGPAELQCIVALESLSCNTPVILANKGATVELVVPEKNGFLFDYPDADDLALQIKKIWQSGWTKDAIDPYARTKMINEHSQEISIEKYNQVYHRAIEMINSKNI